MMIFFFKDFFGIVQARVVIFGLQVDDDVFVKDFTATHQLDKRIYNGIFCAPVDSGFSLYALSRGRTYVTTMCIFSIKRK